MSDALAEVLDAFKDHLYLPDPGPVLVTLGTIAANRLDGDPVWLLLVGAPGNLKTEILQPTANLPDVYSVGNLTEAGLLSGMIADHRPQDATGGLLRQIGDFGIILCKDFTSILSGPREKRAQVFAALREVYDGAWTRVLGTDGGRAFSWKGKVGFLGGVTPIVDRHHSFMNTMGERFVLYRMPELEEAQQAQAALDHAEVGERMRRELTAAVEGFLEQLDFRGPGPKRSDEQTTHLKALATVIARGRSTVVRDGNQRSIELVLPPEAPTRIAIVLDRLRAGLEAVGVEQWQVSRLLKKVGFDCMPVVRGKVLQHMALAPDEPVQSAGIAEMINQSDSATRREMEDLRFHGLLDCFPRGAGKPHDWKLSQLARTHLAVIAKSTEAPNGGEE